MTTKLLMKFIHIVFVFILAPSLFLNGCSDQPSELGAGLLSPQDFPHNYIISTSATADSSFLYRIKGTSNTLVGSFSDPANLNPIESRALMQFEGFTSIPDTSVIDSAVVSLVLNYKFVNMSGRLDFSVYEMPRKWSQSTFSWDSSNTGDIFTEPLIMVSVNINDEDSLLVFRIDTLVRKWVAERDNSPYGLILKPDVSSCEIIAGVLTSTATDLRPVLTVNYRASDTSLSVKTLVSRSAQSAFVANGDIPESGSVVILQSGIGSRGLLRFDSLSVPKQASINRAVLEFSVDQNLSFMNGRTHDSVYAHMLRSTSFPYDSIALATLCSPVFTGSQKIFRADVKNIVQQWVTTERNLGILLRSYDEYSGFDRVAVYGADSPDSLRPKLTITYSKLP